MTGAVTTGVIGIDGVSELVRVLRADGWRVVAPTVRDGVITHAEIDSIADLPAGVGDDQDSARYRLRPRGDGALFGYAVAAASWKQQLFPARELLRRVDAAGHDLPDRDVPGGSGDAEPVRRALLGVRSCDLHALGIHDAVLRDRAFADPRYQRRREATFIITVTCAAPGGSCFCASMGTGPDPATGTEPSAGFDLALTELLDGGDHRFLVRTGSDRGARLLERLPRREAGVADAAAAQRVVATAVERMGRRLDPSQLRELLYDNAEHPRWDEVAERCLSCGNCTMVCPTCFCTTTEDTTDLATGTHERWRLWDSCFTGDFTYLHGGSVRTGIGSRYRQWATHKFASWWDQFGSAGCVGCGRCVTWCPVGIDITAEVAAIRATPLPGTAERPVEA